jgi:hypothetical protein
MRAGPQGPFTFELELQLERELTRGAQTEEQYPGTGTTCCGTDYRYTMTVICCWDEWVG